MYGCCGKKGQISESKIKKKQTVKTKTTTTTVVKKKDDHKIRASKFYGANDEPAQILQKHGYQPVHVSGLRTDERQTRLQSYAVESNKMSGSQVSRSLKQLDFTLDEDPGVSNTFDIPTFDYKPILIHNIYSGRNSRISLPYELHDYQSQHNYQYQSLQRQNQPYYA